jgi:hypothetical protein
MAKSTAMRQGQNLQVAQPNSQQQQLQVPAVSSSSKPCGLPGEGTSSRSSNSYSYEQQPTARCGAIGAPGGFPGSAAVAGCTAAGAGKLAVCDSTQCSGQ